MPDLCPVTRRHTYGPTARVRDRGDVNRQARRVSRVRRKLFAHLEPVELGERDSSADALEVL